MRLVLPKQVEIGKRWFRVKRDLMPERLLAEIVFGRTKTIYITKKKLVPRDELEEAFWHEVTHGVLRDMGNPLWRKEIFVKAFAKRLAAVIKQMRFR